MDSEPVFYLRLAARLEDQAEVARARADQLGRALAGTHWQSRSAARFRPAAEDAIRRIGPAARRCDEVADGLRRYANRVAEAALAAHRYGR